MSCTTLVLLIGVLKPGFNLPSLVILGLGAALVAVLLIAARDLHRLPSRPTDAAEADHHRPVPAPRDPVDGLDG